MSFLEHRDQSQWRLTVSTMVVFNALLLPTLVDLAFVGRVLPSAAIVTLASMGPALVLLWCFAAIVALPFIGRRYVAEDGDRVDWPGVMLASIFSAVALAAAGWYGAPLFFDVFSPGIALSDEGLQYARFRLLGLPVLAVFLSLRELLKFSDGESACLWSVVVLNATNVVLNLFFASAGGLGLAAATVVSAFLAVAIMVGTAGYLSHNSESCMGKITDLRPGHCRGILADGARGLAVWIGPLVAMATLLWIAAATDRAAIAEAVELTGLARPDGLLLPPWFVAPETGPLRVLFVDWSTELASSRPPVYLAAFTLIAAIFSVAVTTAFALADSALSVFRSGNGGDKPAATRAVCRRTAIASAYLLAAVAVVALLIPDGLLALFTGDAHIRAAAIPAIRLTASVFPFVGVAIVVTTAGTDDALWRRSTAVLLASGGAAALAYLLALVLSTGFMGIWWSVAVAIAALTALVTIDFFWCTESRDD